jgi:ATP-dependent exoDNAse (exonuclease V) beta subunit
MSKEEIKHQWSSGDAAQKGTKLHYDIECFYNEQNVNNESKEYKFFLQFSQDYQHLNPYRTEWMIYYEELRLAGSIDMIFEDKNGDLWVYDWKRTGELSPESFKDKKALTPCISEMPDCKFWHYALQLNVYRTILQEKYGKKIVGMCLVRLHPDNPYNNYERIEVPFLDNEVQALFEYRREQLKNAT